MMTCIIQIYKGNVYKLYSKIAGRENFLWRGSMHLFETRITPDKFNLVHTVYLIR